MTTITPTTGAAQSTTNSASSGAVLNSDFETFLKMLTVQMQNQDPLNPMNSSEYAMQLATFSGLEQQVKTNDLLNSLISMAGQSRVSELANWIGLEGRAGGPAYFDGVNSLEVFVAPVSYADVTELVVTNAAGQEVDRMTLPAGSEMALWDGRASSGVRLPAGQYSFGVENFVDGNLVERSSGETWSKVLEARNDAGTLRLRLQSGAEIQADAVTGVRQPSV